MGYGSFPTSSGGGGGVSSVAMTVPSFLAVAGSPITSTGTFAVTLQTQSANLVFAGPDTGADAAPTFRALVDADLPASAYTFAALTDLTTAIVPSIIILATGEIQWGSVDEDAGTEAYHFSDPTTAGQYAQGATGAYAEQTSIADETNNVGNNYSKGGSDIQSKDYSVGDIVLDGNFTHHYIVGDPGANVGVDYLKVKSFYIVSNVSGVDVTLEGTGGGAFWYGQPTFLVKDQSSYIFISQKDNGEYKVFGPNKFAALTDLTTANVPAVNIHVVGTMAWTAANSYRQGSETISDFFYQSGETVLDPLYSAHTFFDGVGSTVDVDGAVNGTIVYVKNDGSTPVTLNGINGTTFDGESTLSVEDGKAYILLSSYNAGAIDYFVFVSGIPASNAIVETGSFGSPVAISTDIAIPADLESKIYVVGDGAPVVDPTLGDGIASQQLWIFGTDDTNTVVLNGATNLLLVASIIVKLGTILYLQWTPGLDKWVEVSRNGI